MWARGMKEVTLLTVTKELSRVPWWNKRGYLAHSHKGVKQDPVVEYKRGYPAHSHKGVRRDPAVE